MLVIDQATYDAIIAHARRDHPDEACGVVAGPAGSDRPERFIPMQNAARSPTFYEFDSMDLLRLYREMDDRNEEPIVIYHSHTATDAYPSRTDVSYASEPSTHYVLVSTREPDVAQFRSFRIVDSEITEEEVAVVTSYHAKEVRHTHGWRRTTGLLLANGRHMTIEVRIPTILRGYTGGEKAVAASGGTLDELIRDLDANHPGLRERLIEEGKLRRFVNVYLNDEDVRFLGGLETPVSDGDSVTVLPAVAGG